MMFVYSKSEENRLRWRQNSDRNLSKKIDTLLYIPMAWVGCIRSFLDTTSLNFNCEILAENETLKKAASMKLTAL